MPAFPVPLSVRARRAIVRPAVRRTVAAALALVTAPRRHLPDRRGRRRPGAGARPGRSRSPPATSGRATWSTPARSTCASCPAASSGEATMAEAPVGAVVRHPIVAGEPVAPARLAPDGLTGAAALVPRGVPGGGGAAGPGGRAAPGRGRPGRRGRRRAARPGRRRAGGADQGSGDPAFTAGRAGGGGRRRRARPPRSPSPSADAPRVAWAARQRRGRARPGRRLTARRCRRPAAGRRGSAEGGRQQQEDETPSTRRYTHERAGTSGCGRA